MSCGGGGLVEKSPGIGNDNKDIVSLEPWRMDHNAMIKQASDFPCAGELGVRLELGISPLGHFLAQDGPGIRVNGKDDEDLERVETSEWSLVGVPRTKISGKLDEAAALQLGGVQTWEEVLSQQGVTRAGDGASEGNDGRDTGEAVHGGEEPGKHALGIYQTSSFKDVHMGRGVRYDLRLIALITDDEGGHRVEKGAACIRF